MNFLVILTLSLFLPYYAYAANILYIIPFAAMSHYIVLRPIGLELARRGHNVTVITTKREKDPPPNYHEVMVENKMLWDVIGGERPNLFTMVDMPVTTFHHKILWPGGIAFTEVILNSPDVQNFLKSDNTFDLVINEQFFQEALYTLAYKYNAPLALVSSYGNCIKHNFANRNPLQLATVVHEFLDLNDYTSYWGRLQNFYFTFYDYFLWRFRYLKQQEDLVRKYLPEIADKVPDLYTLQSNVSLMLINSHFSFDTPNALLPNIVEIGGIHLTESNTSLPTDLQKLLDESSDGVIYMNFGSNIRSTELALEKKKAFVNVFKRLKHRVLWKWEDDHLQDKPNNLVTRKWFPQKEILAHPNIKVFISHGGLIGTQEAIYNGVPLVGVPIYADQFNNLLLAQDAGFGKIIQYHDINENTLYNTLTEVLNDSSFMKNAKEMSRRSKDRPMTALDTAIFWIEYIIRNKGAEYMKNPAKNLSWIAYNMLDVYATILVLLISTIIILVKVAKSVHNFFYINDVNVTFKKKLT